MEPFPELEVTYRTPEIAIMFMLDKLDPEDFDREAVSRRLGLTPTSTEGPRLSPGKICRPEDHATAQKAIPLATVLWAPEPPFSYVLHGGWYLELPRMESWSTDAPLKAMEA